MLAYYDLPTGALVADHIPKIQLITFILIFRSRSSSDLWLSSSAFSLLRSSLPVHRSRVSRCGKGNPHLSGRRNDFQRILLGPNRPKDSGQEAAALFRNCASN